MKITIVGVLLCSISFVAVSQIKFQPGYFYDNQNQKTECLIENADWKNNPKEFKYRLTEGDEPKTADISSVKEFGIYNYSKYVRGAVKIDRWAESTNRYDDSKNPKWSDEVLFLEVLVDGKASLFFYHDDEITRLFYKIQDSSYEIKLTYYIFPDTSIRQLVYKKYIVNNVPAANEIFRKQLLDDVRCDKISTESVFDLDYKASDLAEYFKKYNECVGSSYVDYREYSSKSITESWHLKLLLGLNLSFINISNGEELSNTTFSPFFSFKAGAEIEYVLPFGMNTWSMFTGVSYLSFNTSKNIIVSSEFNSYDATATNHYRFFEFPIGVRHTLYLNDDSGFFVDAAFVFFLNNNSFFTVDFPHQQLNLDTRNGGGMAFGCGYFYKNISAEVRYYTTREYLYGWSSGYEAVTMNIGYKVF